ncbi:hypothetical protein [Kosmotoga pacifica]|nr:hypothetical protein [Kosmotoga pacifica]
MDSIALSWQQRRILKEFNKWELVEDELKEYILMEIKESTGRTRVILERILNLILKIDEAQDRQIDEIAKKAILIAHINRISNQILAPYDVSVERYKPRENRQLVLNLPIELGIQTFRRRDVS